MRAHLLIICLFFLFCQTEIFAQQNKDSLFAAYYSEAKNFIDLKEYSQANESFKKALALKTILPDELAYFYGYTLVNLNKYVPGRAALNKYLQLTGDTGRYRSYALEQIHLADCKEAGSYTIEETCLECKGSGRSLIDCRLCQGHGKQICNVCNGIGAYKKRNNFGETFSTCTRCGGLGETICTQCSGSGDEEARCFSCDGRGKVRLKKECDSLLLNSPE